MPRITAGALFYRGRRVGLFQEGTYGFKTNSNQELTDEGPYNTDGVFVSTITATLLVPAAGTTLTMLQDALNQVDVDIAGGIIDGNILEFVNCRATELEYTSNVKDGTLKGKFTWQSGKPNLGGSPIPNGP